MARRIKKKKSNSGEKLSETTSLKPETKKSVAAIFAFMIAAFFTLAAFGKAGIMGDSLHRAFNFLFGRGFFLLPLVSFLGGVSFLASFRAKILSNTIIGGFVLILSALGMADIVLGGKTGGYVGFAVALPMMKLFDFWASIILLLAICIISVIFMFNIALRIPFGKSREEEFDEDDAIESVEAGPDTKDGIMSNVRETLQKFKEELSSVAKKESEDTRQEGLPEDDFELKRKAVPARIIKASFESPPLDFFEDDRGKPSSGDIKANLNIIKRTFQNFGIDVEMNEVNIGPSVTQYTLKPAEGVRLSKITALHNDLSLALAVHPLRIEAPIPGRSLVGLEIPNKKASLVGVKTLLNEDDFRKSDKPLLLVLGRGVTNKPVVADLGRMPHLLIAGSTGSGKSVCIHSILTSLLYKNPPERLRFLLFDPKRVELTIYRGLPHLLSDVIVEPKKTISALRWAVKEMERRYEILSSKGARDIAAYHHLVYSAENKDGDLTSLMPYIVIVIDELADVMGVYPRELEALVVRLAQMSRAVGIHLILSTQRPSVEVITGLIKANITSRIAFQVASQVDSRTILDRAGAEKLLGNGDMLFLSGDASKPRRLQGAFVTEKEIRRLVDYFSQEYPESLEEGSVFSEDAETGDANFDFSQAGDVDDVLYDDAKEIVVRAGKASASYLQRRMRIGYARAARLLDILEEKGIIGPADGAKPRGILVKKDEEGSLPESPSDYGEN